LCQRAEQRRPVAPSWDIIHWHAEIDTALPALHRPGDRAARRDGVHADFVAERGGAKHGIRVAHAAKGAEGEERFVFEPPRGLRPVVASAVMVLATDRAGGAG